MAFIINAHGERVNVDMELDRFSKSVPLYSDNADLEEYYLLNLYKGNVFEGEEIELIKQLEFRNKPTKDEIMYAMWSNGLSRYDIATIESGYRLDWND